MIYNENITGNLNTAYTKKVAYDDYYNFNPILSTEVATNKLKIYTGKFEDEVNKKGLIVPNDCITLDIKDIVNKEWSLKYEDYVQQEEEVLNDGIEYKTLGEVCEFKFGTRITKSKDEVKKIQRNHTLYMVEVI